MDTQIIKIQGVRGYCDNCGTAWLNAEDVARGLGWTQFKNGVEYVRWETINGYLREFDFPKIVGKDDFIPENMLYRLVWKSRDERALAFQSKIADEILPAIRKTGLYINPNAPIDPNFLRKIADQIEQRDRQIAVLNTQVAELQPKASYYDRILQCPDLVSTSTIAKDYGFSAKTFNKILRELKIQFKQGGVWLLYQKYASQGWTSTKTYHFTDIAGQEHCRVHTYWTQKGRLGLYDLLKHNGYLPTIEQAA